VQMEIIVRGRHKNPLYGVGVVSGLLWTLTPRKGFRDTGGGTSANFLHTPARLNKFDTRKLQNWDRADNPFDKLPTALAKPLRRGDLSGRAQAARDMWMDVNKRARPRGQNCMSPIHAHSDSNLKNLESFR
jgi:hypothetical protein